MQPEENEVERLKVSHTREAIRTRLREGARHSYLRDAVYGAVDGTVTTFAVVSGVAGAGLAPGIVLILGMANLAGDGFSMAIGNYLGTRADRQLIEIAKKAEARHIEIVPDGEAEEIRQIFASKGFAGEELENAVRIITSDRELWINTMVREELGMPVESASPVKAAVITFVAFTAAGFLPLLSFFFDFIFKGAGSDPFMTSSILTGAAFFIVGVLKSRYVGEKWWLAGLQTFFAGGAAAALAFAIGAFLRQFIAI